MATVPVNRVSPSGKTATYQNATVLDKVKPGDRTFIHVKNDSAGSITVTVDDTRSVEPSGAKEFDPDLGVVIAPSSESFIGPLPASRFANTDGFAWITYSAFADVTITGLSV